ncbi:mitochondrial carrier [Pisolithus croceorrhizus]|nr:mitochondrial carrier [Pisolithus croceorrhizus]
MLGLLDMIVLTASLAISLAIMVPLVGAIVRFRANYNPKGLQLDPEGDVQPHTGPVISSFFAMLKRVYDIEGWPGLYKGLSACTFRSGRYDLTLCIVPTLISSLIITLFLIVFLDDSSFRHRAYTAPSAGILGTLFYSIFAMLVSLPQTIITDRAITTPHKLTWFNAAHSCRILLTPTERRRPWIIYLTPGLLAAQVAHISYVVLILRSVRRLILPELATQSGGHDISPLRLSVFFVLALASTAVLTPLEVISIRLAIQRNYASAEYNSVSQEGGDTEDVAEYAGANEDVIGLRSDRAPYTGLIDCAKTIVEEEGWTALYRAWWLTMLGCVSGAFS